MPCLLQSRQGTGQERVSGALRRPKNGQKSRIPRKTRPDKGPGDSPGRDPGAGKIHRRVSRGNWLAPAPGSTGRNHCRRFPSMPKSTEGKRGRIPRGCRKPRHMRQAQNCRRRRIPGLAPAGFHTAPSRRIQPRVFRASRTLGTEELLNNPWRAPQPCNPSETFDHAQGEKSPARSNTYKAEAKARKLQAGSRGATWAASRISTAARKSASLRWQRAGMPRRVAAWKAACRAPARCARRRVDS